MPGRPLLRTAAWMTVLGVSVVSISAQTAVKLPKNKYTPEQVKSSCDKVGGEYFPQGQSGTYGCENRNNGAMALCNGNNDCWGYNQSRKKKEHKKIVRFFQLDACVAAK